MLGNIIPNLTNIAREHRGLFAHVLDAPVDWTQMYRTVPYAGTERDGEVLVAKNVSGFRDDAANAILYGAYEAELLQIVGRMRGQLADPVDPSIVPTVYVIGGIAVPGWDVDEVIGLADVRERLGLSVRERAQIGRPSKKPIEQQIADRCVKRGPEPTVRWLVKGLFPKYGESAVTVALHLVESTGRTVPHRVISAAAELVNELAAADRSGRR